MEPMTYETPGGVDLELRIPAGAMRISAIESAQTRVQVTGEHDPEDVTIRLAPGSNGRHRLLVEQKRKGALEWFGRSEQLMVDIELPRGSSVDASSGSADLGVTGEIDTLAFRSGSGDLSFESIGRSAGVKVASGDVSGGAVGGDLTVHSASGDVRVRSVAGKLAVHSVSGDVSVDFAEGSVEATLVSGDVTLGSVAAGEIKIRTVSGDIGIGVRPGLRVWLNLDTKSGDVASELEPSEEATGAAVRIQANSLSGDVRVARSSAMPAQPVGS
jgi:DUF4097 and DUF4098 domain-containing protein YvlB